MHWHPTINVKEATPNGNSKESSTQEKSGKESCEESGTQEKSGKKEITKFS